MESSKLDMETKIISRMALSNCSREFLNPNLGSGGEEGVKRPPPLCWFSLNNSETPKAVKLA